MNASLIEYARGVKKIVASWRSLSNARIELAKLRGKAKKELDKMSEDERLEWELRYLAKPIAAIYASTPYLSNRGTITFKKFDNKQCTQSIVAYSDLRLTEEEILEKAQVKSDSANARQKANRAAAASQDEETLTISVKPSVAQLKAVVDLCNETQLQKIIALAQAALAARHSEQAEVQS